MRRVLVFGAAAVLLGTLTTACTSPDSGKDGLTIFATTGYLADAAHNIAPDANVITMIGPGGDPHQYEPTTKDLEEMRSADLVLWNGLNLEARMTKQLESLGKSQLSVGSTLDTSDLLPWEDDGTESDSDHPYDPHIWNDPQLWSQAVNAIGDKLGEIDPDNAQQYSKAADTYEQQISEVADQAREELQAANPRILVTGHDAFNYFGRTFDFQIEATDFVSTTAAKDPTEISDLADLIAEKKVPVIFKDNQANPQAVTSLMEAVNSRGWNVTVSDQELFADSLGPTSPTDTYLGVFQHNAQVVADALS